MEGYSLGKDMQLVLAKLDSLTALVSGKGQEDDESRAQVRGEDAKPETESDHLVRTYGQFGTQWVAFRANRVELYPTGQFNISAEIYNASQYSKYYAWYGITISDPRNGLSLWYQAWEGYVGALQTIPISVPTWGGGIKDYYTNLRDGSWVLQFSARTKRGI